MPTIKLTLKTDALVTVINIIDSNGQFPFQNIAFVNGLRELNLPAGSYTARILIAGKPGQSAKLKIELSAGSTPASRSKTITIPANDFENFGGVAFNV